MNEQKKITLPGSISNIPTTNYGRAYSIVSTWAHHYTPDEMKRLLIGRGVDISDIDVEAMHKVCSASLEGLTAPAGGLEITYEDGTKESRSASASLMQPKTPEEHENAWIERKRGLVAQALANHPAIKHTGESEFSRISDYGGATDFKSGNETINRILSEGYRLDEIRLADLGVGKLLDDALLSYRGASRPLPILTSVMEAGGIFSIPKPEPAHENPYSHVYRTYSDDYLREVAIKRKAKRIKNQRRRRNAKARRK